MSDFRILYSTPEDGVVIFVPAPNVSEEQAIRLGVPENTAYEVVPVSNINSDRTFRNAWKRNGKNLEVDVPKAKVISHERRRSRRAEEFAPFDEVIMKQIPGANAQAAEAERNKIRAKYDAIQTEIDAAVSAAELKSIIERM